MTNHELHLELLKLEQEGLQLQKSCLSSGPFQNLPEYTRWMSSVMLFAKRHLDNHPMKKNLEDAYFFRNDYTRGFSEMLGLLDVIGKDDEFWREFKSPTMSDMTNPVFGQYTHCPEPSNTYEQTVQKNQIGKLSGSDKGSREKMNKSVFIVHGHDNEAKQETARVLEKVGFDAIILHEQPDAGKTIIEKIEAYTDVSFAVVLYTECDLGRAKKAAVDDERYRARQNVVFEHGYLIGKLGRDKVCALVKGNVETPGDITGVVYTKMDDSGAWKLQLVRNMKATGLDVDANRLM